MLLIALFHQLIFSANYAAIIDAGETKTALHIFELNGVNTVEIDIPQNNKSIPLHHALYDKSLIADILSPLLEIANSTIAEENRTQTKLFLFGTSGIRNLNENEQEDLLNASRDYLRANSAFNISDDAVETLDIIEESIYYWISVNTILDRFTGNISNTAAVASFGSAALQVTFAIQDSESSKNKYNVVLEDGQKLTVYTYASNSLNTKNAKYIHLKKLAGEQGKSAVESPCFPNDISEKYTIDYSGKWDSEKCYDFISEHMLVKGECDNGYCSVDGNSLPSAFEDREVYAIDGFAYADEYFNFNKNLSIIEHMEEVDGVCGKNITGLNENSYTIDYCFFMKLTDNFLIRGLGCNNQTASVYRVNQLQNENGVNVTIDWHIGAVLAHAGNTKITPVEDTASKKLITIILGLFVGIIVIGMIVFIIMKCKSLKEQEDLSESDTKKNLLENNIHNI